MAKKRNGNGNGEKKTRNRLTGLPLVAQYIERLSNNTGKLRELATAWANAQEPETDNRISCEEIEETAGKIASLISVLSGEVADLKERAFEAPKVAPKGRAGKFPIESPVKIKADARKRFPFLTDEENATLIVVQVADGGHRLCQTSNGKQVAVTTTRHLEARA